MPQITVLVPASLAEAAVPVHRAQRRAHPKPSVLTLIDNRKPKARLLLEMLGAQLQERIPDLELRLVRKESAGASISEIQAEEIARSSDMVIAGVGDCGACSAFSMKDVLAIENLGTPTALVVTAPFEKLVTTFAETLGAHDYPVATIPHPMASRTDAELYDIVDSIADHVLQQLTLFSIRVEV